MDRQLMQSRRKQAAERLLRSIRVREECDRANAENPPSRQYRRQRERRAFKVQWSNAKRRARLSKVKYE